jgi:flagellar biosynthesis GTPase FlhF
MAVLRGNTIHANKQAGVVVEKGSAGSVLESNVIHTNDMFGVVIVGEGSMAALRGNTIHANKKEDIVGPYAVGEAHPVFEVVPQDLNQEKEEPSKLAEQEAKKQAKKAKQEVDVKDAIFVRKEEELATMQAELAAKEEAMLATQQQALAEVAKQQAETAAKDEEAAKQQAEMAFIEQQLEQMKMMNSAFTRKGTVEKTNSHFKMEGDLQKLCRGVFGSPFKSYYFVMDAHSLKCYEVIYLRLSLTPGTADSSFGTECGCKQERS